MSDDNDVQTDGGDRSRKLRDHLRQAEENDLAEHSHLRLIKADAQIAFALDKMDGTTYLISVFLRVVRIWFLLSRVFTQKSPATAFLQ